MSFLESSSESSSCQVLPYVNQDQTTIGNDTIEKPTANIATIRAKFTSIVCDTLITRFGEGLGTMFGNIINGYFLATFDIYSQKYSIKYIFQETRRIVDASFYETKKNLIPPILVQYEKKSLAKSFAQTLPQSISLSCDSNYKIIQKTQNLKGGFVKPGSTSTYTKIVTQMADQAHAYVNSNSEFENDTNNSTGVNCNSNINGLKEEKVGGKAILIRENEIEYDHDNDNDGAHDDQDGHGSQKSFKFDRGFVSSLIVESIWNKNNIFRLDHRMMWKKELETIQLVVDLIDSILLEEITSQENSNLNTNKNEEEKSGKDINDNLNNDYNYTTTCTSMDRYYDSLKPVANKSAMEHDSEMTKQQRKKILERLSTLYATYNKAIFRHLRIDDCDCDCDGDGDEMKSINDKENKRDPNAKFIITSSDDTNDKKQNVISVMEEKKKKSDDDDDDNNGGDNNPYNGLIYDKKLKVLEIKFIQFLFEKIESNYRNCQQDCPHGFKKFSTKEDRYIGWWFNCDRCKKRWDASIDEEIILFGCRKCNWDVCEKCYQFVTTIQNKDLITLMQDLDQLLILYKLWLAHSINSVDDDDNDNDNDNESDNGNDIKSIKASKKHKNSVVVEEKEAKSDDNNYNYDYDQSKMHPQFGSNTMTSPQIKQMQINAKTENNNANANTNTSTQTSTMNVIKASETTPATTPIFTAINGLDMKQIDNK